MRDTESGLVEVLESRRLLSSATLGGAGLLTVRADAGAANTITVQYSDDGLSVDVSVSSVKGHAATRTLTKSFARTMNITKVLVVGSTKSNDITVGTSNNFLIETEIQDHGGSDTIAVGDQNATINGGHGDATITAGGGDDTIFGATGSNQITVGDGNDSIQGGNGGDTIIAGNGTDIIVGGHKATAFHVGDGNDMIFGEAAKDIIVAGNGTDTIWAGKGNSQITAGDGNDALGAVVGRNTIVGGNGHNTFLVRSLKNESTNYDSSKDTLVIVQKQPKPPKI